MQMLEDDWVKGKTAATAKVLSDEKLKVYRQFKSGIELKVFEGLVQGSLNPTKVKQGLIERAFKSFDVNKKGYINTNDINKITNTLINYITNYKHATDAATFLRVRSGYEICRCGELDAETHFEMPRIAEANTKL